MLRRLLCLVVAMLLAAPSASGAQTYGQQLQATFSPLYAPGRQFAVMTFGQAMAALTPAPRTNAPVADGGADPSAGFNYLTYEGTPAVHSEAAMVTYAQRIYARQPTPNEVHVYSRLIPCAGCVAQLVAIQASLITTPNAPQPRYNLYYLENYAGATDQENYASLLALRAAGWQVSRVCPVGDACGTFLANLLKCAKANPVICQHCAGWYRNYGITTYINDGWERLYSRRGEAWYYDVKALKWSDPAEGLQVAAAMYKCAESNALTPVGFPPSVWEPSGDSGEMQRYARNPLSPSNP